MSKKEKDLLMAIQQVKKLIEKAMDYDTEEKDKWNYVLKGYHILSDTDTKYVCEMGREIIGNLVSDGEE